LKSQKLYPQRPSRYSDKYEQQIEALDETLSKNEPFGFTVHGGGLKIEAEKIKAV
jgi:hypothetical protein